MICHRPAFLIRNRNSTNVNQRCEELIRILVRSKKKFWFGVKKNSSVQNFCILFHPNFVWIKRTKKPALRPAFFFV